VVVQHARPSSSNSNNSAISSNRHRDHRSRTADPRARGRKGRKTGALRARGPATLPVKGSTRMAARVSRAAATTRS